LKNSGKHLDNELNQRLAARGFRSTSQREHVYEVLLAEPDHPTAEQVFLRAKKGMPEISMATVYNCLDTLVASGLVREVHLHRSAMRYCPNMQNHHHFYCDDCGGAFDIDSASDAPALRVSMPRGFKADRYEITIRGLCAKCSTGSSKQGKG
jgi:Fur family peroxide stress response transcriptional regulator